MKLLDLRISTLKCVRNSPVSTCAEHLSVCVTEVQEIIFL